MNLNMKKFIYPNAIEKLITDKMTVPTVNGF